MTDPTLEFEFNDEQDKVIGDLAAKMRTVGQFLMLLGTLAFLGGLFQITSGGAGALILGVVFLLMGSWTVNASVAFKVIVDTKGSDIRLLMDALANLKKVYSVLYWPIVIALLLIIAYLVVTLVTVLFMWAAKGTP